MLRCHKVAIARIFADLIKADRIIGAQYNYGSSYGTTSYGTNTNSTYVNGYIKSNGTYVSGTLPQNSTNHDNWSTIGNTNIYTGTFGSRAKDYSTGAYNYGSGRTIRTGSRGGQYYIKAAEIKPMFQNIDNNQKEAHYV